MATTTARKAPGKGLRKLCELVAEIKAERASIVDGATLRWSMLADQGEFLVKTVADERIEVALTAAKSPQVRMRPLPRRKSGLPAVEPEHDLPLARAARRLSDLRHLVLGHGCPVVLRDGAAAVLLDRHPDARSTLVGAQVERERARASAGLVRRVADNEREVRDIAGTVHALSGQTAGFEAEEWEALRGMMPHLKVLAPFASLYFQKRGQLAAISGRTGGTATDPVTMLRFILDDAGERPMPLPG